MVWSLSRILREQPAIRDETEELILETRVFPLEICFYEICFPEY